MGLVTDPATGAHSFVPDPQNIVQDIDALNLPRQTRGQVRPLQIADWYDEPLGPSYPGGYYFRLTLIEGRGGIVQDAFMGDEESAAMSSGDMVFDRDGIGRPAFKTNSSTLNQPGKPHYGDRFYGATFLDVPVFQMSEIGGLTTIHLFKDNGTGSTPNIVPVTGFTPPAGATIAYCLEAGQVNGAPALFIGWNAAAVNTLQVLTDLNNPPTATSVAIGAAGGCYGVCQVGIDGNSVQAYTADASGGIIKMFNTNVGLGSATIVSRARLPQGGYTVGLGNIGYNPQVYYVVPKNGQTMLGATSYTGGQNSFYPPTFKGQLLAADLRAFEVHDVKTALDFVLYATLSKYGIFYCNGRQHQYLTAGSDFPVDSLINWPADSDKTRICRGHYCIDDRIFWKVNRTNANGSTTMFTMEFDTVLYKVRQVSAETTIATPDTSAARLYSAGGPRLPYSELTRNLIDHADARWYYQYQNRSSELGWDLRHTDGSSAGGGVEYEATATWQTPRLRLKKRPRAKFVTKRVTGPSLRNLRAGGTDADSKVTIDITGQPRVEFLANESALYVDRRPVAEDVFRDNDSWSYELQATITGHQGSLGHDNGVDSTKYAGNYACVTIEGFYFDEVLGNVPSLASMRQWDGAA